MICEGLIFQHHVVKVLAEAVPDEQKVWLTVGKRLVYDFAVSASHVDRIFLSAFHKPRPLILGKPSFKPLRQKKDSCQASEGGSPKGRMKKNLPGTE